MGLKFKGSPWNNNVGNMGFFFFQIKGADRNKLKQIFFSKSVVY